MLSDVCGMGEIGGVEEISISSLMFTDVSLADSNSVIIYILILYFTFDRYFQLFVLLFI